ncbi:MAG: hypothetical protein AB8G26_07540 [Ilumatobacter sp.]
MAVEVDPADIELTADERVVAHLVGVDAGRLGDVFHALLDQRSPAVCDAERAVLFGLVSVATWRIASAGGVGALGLEERGALEPIRAWERSPVGEVFVSQGLRPVSLLPDVVSLLTMALEVSGQAVGIEQVRRAI